MPNHRLLRVFLCHAKEDKTFVREFHKSLSAEGWMDVWLDELKLLPGQNWDKEIEKAVEEADAVIVCLSNSSVTKEGFVQSEMSFILDIARTKPEEAIFVIPLRVENCQVPRRLRAYQYVDCFPEERRDWAYQRVLDSLKARSENLGLYKSEKHSLPPIPASAPKGNVEVTTSSWTQIEKKYLKLKDLSLEFAHIPKGNFLMGSKKGNIMALENEFPQHVVSIPYDYLISRFPVTYLQYAELALAEPNIPSGQEKHPVVEISWYDAQKYIARLNRKYKKDLPRGYAFRLPSESEWEKAARGGNGREWPWGDEFDEKKCNSEEGGKGSTTPVGIYSPLGDSFYDVSDMAGNVWEWTRSRLLPYPYNPSDGREDEDVTDQRVVKGGSFFGNLSSVRSAVRVRNIPDLTFVYLGFRIVVSPDSRNSA